MNIINYFEKEPIRLRQMDQQDQQGQQGMNYQIISGHVPDDVVHTHTHTPHCAEFGSPLYLVCI